MSKRWEKLDALRAGRWIWAKMMLSRLPSAVIHSLVSSATSKVRPAFVDRALTLNPNLAAAWHYSGLTKILLGEPDIAIEHLAIAMRLSPLDPFIHYLQSVTALAHLYAGRYDEACMWSEKSLHGGHMSGY